jgi:hypothetical protein
MDAFQQSADADYHRRLRDHYKATIPEHTAKYDDTALLKVIAESHGRARRYGLQTADGLSRFIGLAIVINPHYDEEPRTARFLAAPEVDPDVKIKMLCDMVAANLRNPADHSTRPVQESQP